MIHYNNTETQFGFLPSVRDAVIATCKPIIHAYVAKKGTGIYVYNTGLSKLLWCYIISYIPAT